MAYSRWSSSTWYTYADVNGGFTVAMVGNFDLKSVADIDDAIAEVRSDDAEYSEVELAELRGYMELYLKDEGVI